MSNFNPTLRVTSHAPYMAPVSRRRTDVPTTTSDSTQEADFGTELKKANPTATTSSTTGTTSPAAATTATTPATTTTTTATTTTVPTTTTTSTKTTDTSSHPGTIGTVTYAPSATVTSPTPAVTSPLAPTAQSLFGDNPWSSNAGGSGPNGSYSYNQYYFATPATAAKVAQMLGGTVVTANAITPYGPFIQNEPNQMIQMPDGRQINAGLVAGFYDHGYTQVMVDKMVAAEVSGNTMIT